MSIKTEQLLADWMQIQHQTSQLKHLADHEHWLELIAMLTQRADAIQTFKSQYDFSSDPLKLANLVPQIQAQDQALTAQITNIKRLLEQAFEKYQRTTFAESSYQAMRDM